ncbi:MAG: 16S rRNA (cytosine(1402)-N(4))-methyltransferase RsmH [Patescibacteria group bacterium]|nr:16S rRNA (cytosine(1402)-N(4))-methyltransferase RsmH [Patescibacteria group bacterium]
MERISKEFLRFSMHTPVLLQQAIEKLNIKPNGLYIDATFGEGGYSKEIINKGGKVLAIDLDKEQLLKKKSEFLQDKIIFLQGNFSQIEEIAKKNNFYPADGIVFDLGLSMEQIKNSSRGFSYKNEDEILDMRIDINQSLKVVDLIRKKSAEELEEIFSKYSEEINSKKIALEIKKRKRIEKVKDLLKAIDKALGFKSEKTYSRIFQALRIAVNNEFENLKRGLKGALNIIKKEGRIVVVSFHSLEDRIVKNFVRENNLNFLEKKPIKGVFSYERSAKLRTIIL